MDNIRFIDLTARLAHELNRSLCLAIGDDSQADWDNAEQWQKDSAKRGVKMHLTKDAGPDASHVAWMRDKAAEGWKFGEVKDPEKKEHPCMVPFSELEPFDRVKDYLFRSVVHAMRDWWDDEFSSGNVITEEDDGQRIVGTMGA